MAQSKTAAKISNSEAEQLADQIEALKADISSITQTLADMGSSRRDALASAASDNVAQLRSTGERYLKDAQTKAEDIAAQSADAVRKQPATAVGLAVGVGFLLGFLSGRK
ncbi:hypothetical protein AAFO92_10595 [Roseovarius sp. CAU 1744]|uniref:DUF883 family protein n=1 Tax=Roseovarius sp. CAU 1744 TaxID=3140368 RepID=UPI00325A7BC3